MKLVYLAHPVSPIDGETVESNLDSAEWRLRALQSWNQHAAVIAPWIQEIRLGIGDDSNPIDRERVLLRCKGVASRCDEIALCGPRISRGMLGELEALALKKRATIHRFLDRDQMPTIPLSALGVAYRDDGPFWLRGVKYGAMDGACQAPLIAIRDEIVDAIRAHPVTK